jgi:hypothetical protein
MAGPCMSVAPTGTTNRPNVTTRTTKNPVTSGNSRDGAGRYSARLGGGLATFTGEGLAPERAIAAGAAGENRAKDF